jgi:hypothetical protein
MPKASIDQDGYPRWSEDDVDASSRSRYDGAIDAVAKTASVKRASQRQLGCRVALALQLHAASDPGA